MTQMKLTLSQMMVSTCCQNCVSFLTTFKSTSFQASKQLPCCFIELLKIVPSHDSIMACGLKQSDTLSSLFSLAWQRTKLQHSAVLQHACRLAFESPCCKWQTTDDCGCLNEVDKIPLLKLGTNLLSQQFWCSYPPSGRNGFPRLG